MLATITLLTVNEARRRRVLWLAVAMGGLFLGLYALGVWQIERAVRRDVLAQGGAVGASLFGQVFGFILLAGLYVISFLVAMLAVLTSVDTVSGEIASGTVHCLVTKPLPRWQIIVGKWLGFALMLGLFTAGMSAGSMLVVRVLTGFSAVNVLPGIGLMMLQGLVLMSVSLLGGTRLSTLANGVLAFMLYGISFVGSWIEQIGGWLHNEAAVNIGIVASLLMPTHALWNMTAYSMQPPFLRNLPTGPFSVSSPPSVAMVIYSLAYVAVALATAVRFFERRDL
jgi:ABC-type transport system involved in multi-copper enzyme maturation permease subunit